MLLWRTKICSKESLEEIINFTKSNDKSRWIWISSLRLRCYLRVSETFLKGNRVPTITIASVEISTENWRSKGRFTKFHDLLYEISMEQKRVLFIESILNGSLLRWAKRRGYEQQNVGMDLTYYHSETYRNWLIP